MSTVAPLRRSDAAVAGVDLPLRATEQAKRNQIVRARISEESRFSSTSSGREATSVESHRGWASYARPSTQRGGPR